MSEAEEVRGDEVRGDRRVAAEHRAVVAHAFARVQGSAFRV